ncbi:hypothetical protein PH210_19460 [Paenibacillus sp. BSR1-1]|uniref:hypothetical protein n=1 Tax=Paenibacillus sp. BSR1-1 TaxID=3020845 RepID=UPI0025AF4FB8|nr:hypothetical protein [Paenibacillus sp. BSR1-1]MDN3018361.1 hypothetical protein [Paenibacillus sp. BSR1-1]
MKCKIHRCNCRKVWSIQNRKTRTIANTVLLNGEWFAELKPERKCNPKGFVISNKIQDIIFNPDYELVNQFHKVAKLIYDKENVDFNILKGKYLYFAEDGSCYLLKKMGCQHSRQPQTAN